MKKIDLHQMEVTEGGNCFVVGLLSAVVITAAVSSVNPAVVIAAAGLVATHAYKCWMS